MQYTKLDKSEDNSALAIFTIGVIEETLSEVEKRKQERRKGHPFFKGDNIVFEDIAKYADLSGNDYRVRDVMMSNIDFNNVCSLTQKEIGDELGLSAQAVCKCVGKLMKWGLVVRYKKIGTAWFYMVSPCLISRRDNKGRLQLLKEFAEKLVEDCNQEALKLYGLDADLDYRRLEKLYLKALKAQKRKPHKLSVVA